MENNKNVEVLESELRDANFVVGLAILAGTGAGMYMLGRKSGFKRGWNGALNLVKLATEIKKGDDSKEV